MENLSIKCAINNIQLETDNIYKEFSLFVRYIHELASLMTCLNRSQLLPLAKRHHLIQVTAFSCSS